MADTIDAIKQNYPLPSYQYRVTITGMEPMAFSEVSGLNVEFEGLTYRDGMSFKEGAISMPGMKQIPKLTLKKGVMRKGAQLYEWLKTVRLNIAEKRDVIIELLDEEANAVVVWKATNAFPLKMDAPSLNGGSSEVAMETLELTADEVEIDYV